MDFIKREIDSEESRSNPDQSYIKWLTKKMNSGKALTFNDFIKTSRSMNRIDALVENPNLTLEPNTIDVIRYIGDTYIELNFGDNKFYTRFDIDGVDVRFGSTFLSDTEKLLWESFIKPKLNGR